MWDKLDFWSDGQGDDAARRGVANVAVIAASIVLAIIIWL